MERKKRVGWMESGRGVGAADMGADVGWLCWDGTEVTSIPWLPRPISEKKKRDYLSVC